MNLAGTCVPVPCGIQDNVFPFSAPQSASPQTRVWGACFHARYCAECRRVLPPTPTVVREAQTRDAKGWKAAVPLLASLAASRGTRVYDTQTTTFGGSPSRDSGLAGSCMTLSLLG